MAKCLALVSDMIFASKIGGTAAHIGAACEVVSTLEGLRTAVESAPPSAVLVDVECAGADPADAIRLVKTACPQAHLVAFGPHVQVELLDAARAAGADEVLPRSAFAQRLPELLQR